MRKRPFRRPPTLLIAGFLLGALTLFIASTLISSLGSTFSPRVPRQIEETSRAFSEIVKAVSPSVVNISSTKVLRSQQIPYDDLFDFFTPFRMARTGVSRSRISAPASSCLKTAIL